MAAFLTDYGLFLAKIITFALAFLFVLAISIGLLAKGKFKPADKIKFRALGKQLFALRAEYAVDLLNKKAHKQFMKDQKKSQKQRAEQNLAKMFVINFNGDIRASDTHQLEKQVSAVITMAKPSDEVLLMLESPGGLVPHYGLAASQLVRLRDHDIKLTVCIDKVAASGGYLMAAVADKIIAAPFAIIGSIGVLVQLPNFHRLLDHHNIDFEQVSAGEYKRTLTMFGENNEKGREKLQSELEDIHIRFKQHIATYRPNIDLKQTATGEYWLASQAKDFNLVDALSTGQDTLLNALDKYDIFEVAYLSKKGLQQILVDSISGATSTVMDKIISQRIDEKLIT